MIIKGTSRGNPKQLAAHLLRTDTNEHVRILEMNSPVDDLEMTLRDWQLLTAATSGTNGLYHANISPDAGYAMTEEQWERAADVLAEQLGLSHQPRLVILHQKEGREHIHVVWQRTDTDSMTLVSDSWNYLAHEKASLELEQEFGHELVPGKHAKRDRDLQPDFPRAKINHEEWQRAERLGIDPLQFKETITALYHQSDTGQAFKTALEEQGLVLAIGDKRGFVLVDGQEEVYSLSRQLLDVSSKDMKKLLKDIGPLPNVEHATFIQKGNEIMRELLSEPAKQPEPSTPKPKPPSPSKFPLPEPEKPAPKSEPEKDPQQEKLEAALKDRNARETRELKYRQDMEMERLKQTHKAETDELLEARKRVQQLDLSRFYQRYEEHSDEWVKKFFDVIRNKWNPALAEQRRLEKQQRLDEIRTRHRIERETLIETGRLRRETAIEELKHRHGQQLIEQNNRQNAELLRHQREQEHARQILKELEEERRKAELAHKRDGPAPPKRSL